MVRIGDRRLAMLEALARWESPSAALGPEAFVPMAERAGLGTRLTQAVAWAALAQFARLPRRRGLRLSLNMPLPVLLDPAAPAWLGRCIAECGLAPRDLLLELTESTEVRDRAALRAALLRLRRAGLGVLLDDLGLDDPRAALLTLPFAGVKLDRALVGALPRLRRARAQAGAATRQARAAGMTVIAEGVTGAPLWRAVAALGCDLAQGYGVGRPLPGAALSAWASAWSAAGRQVGAP
jgi:EAL domain-containing protein (putative c-di-GMP-specific phosphodiesterase class I)